MISEPFCCDGWSSEESGVDGECPECGYPTVGGDAASGCNWSPVYCNICRYAVDECDVREWLKVLGEPF